MINKFLAGKKKYSVFIATLLTSLVQMFVVDPGAQEGIMEFVPMLAMVLSGIAYLAVEGMRDVQKEKTNTAYYQSQILAYQNGSLTKSISSGESASPAELQPQIQPVQPAPPFDIEAFHAEVLKEVGPKYTESNPATIFYQARDKGQVTECYDIQQALDYWDYLVQLAYEARDFVKSKADKETPPGAYKPQRSELYIMNRDVSNVLRQQEKLQALAKSNVNWKARLPSHQRTLYMVGVLAEQMLS